MKRGNLPLCIAIALAWAATATRSATEPATDWAERPGAALAIDAADWTRCPVAPSACANGMIS